MQKNTTSKKRSRTAENWQISELESSWVGRLPRIVSNREFARTLAIKRIKLAESIVFVIVLSIADNNNNNTSNESVKGKESEKRRIAEEEKKTTTQKRTQGELQHLLLRSLRFSMTCSVYITQFSVCVLHLMATENGKTVCISAGLVG